MSWFKRTFTLYSLVAVTFAALSFSAFAQKIEKVTVYTEDGSGKNSTQVAIYDPNEENSEGLNFVQLFKVSDSKRKFKFKVEVSGNDLPSEITMKTDMDKGPERLNYLITSLYELADDQAKLEERVKEIIELLPKMSTNPFLIPNKTDNPDLPGELYSSYALKRIPSADQKNSVYISDFVQIKSCQTANAIFLYDNKETGARTYLYLYNEVKFHHVPIRVLNVVVSPNESRKAKLLSVNPYQLGEAVTQDEATSFKTVDRTKWLDYYNRPDVAQISESDVFRYEKFPVFSLSELNDDAKFKEYEAGEKNDDAYNDIKTYLRNKAESEAKTYLKVSKLDDDIFLDKVRKAVKATNSNTVWFMPLNETSPLRISTNFRKARFIKIGGKDYVISDAMSDAKNDGLHKGLYYPHETTSYTTSEYLGGDQSAQNMVSLLNKDGVRVMLEEHPDKVSAFDFEYKHLSPEAKKIIDAVLKAAGYQINAEYKDKPLNFLSTKLNNINTGEPIRGYQFFTLRYGYLGRETPGTPGYVRPLDRVPGNPNEMPSSLAEIYTPVVANDGMILASFVQLKSHNLYVELIETLAKMEYYKNIFKLSTDKLIGVRVDAVHMSLLRYDERSQFVRYLNLLGQAFPKVVIAGEVMPDGNVNAPEAVQMAWYGMPLAIIQPPTLLHRDNSAFMVDDNTKRTSAGQKEWEKVIEVLRLKNKQVIGASDSYDICQPVTQDPYNRNTWGDRIATYLDYFDSFTKESYVYFGPNMVSSICAGVECGTAGAYKDFKGDMFKFFMLPYENGNSDQIRLGLSSMYPTIDFLGTFLKDKKYGYNAEEIKGAFGLEDDAGQGFLTAQAFKSENGVVMILRNTINEPSTYTDLYVDAELMKALNVRKTYQEKLRVVFDLFEFPYTTENRAGLYYPEGSLLYKELPVVNNQIQLTRTLKPYEVIVLATTTKKEARDITSEYVRAMMLEQVAEGNEDLKTQYEKYTAEEIFPKWLSKLSAEGVKQPKGFVSLLVDVGLIEWILLDQTNEKRFSQATYLLDLTDKISDEANKTYVQKYKIEDYRNACQQAYTVKDTPREKSYSEKMAEYLKDTRPDAYSYKWAEKVTAVLEKVISSYDKLTSKDINIILGNGNEGLVNYLIDEADKGDEYARYRLSILDLVLQHNISKMDFELSDASYRSFREKTAKYDFKTKTEEERKDVLGKNRQDVLEGKFRFIK